MTAPQASMRDRYRAQVREEIKQAALRQLIQGGPAGVSVNAIAKALGVSGPALYRYFASRDALLTELVVDAYGDLATALDDAVAGSARRAPAERLRAVARAYREWAVGQPHRYRLLFGPPLPGYDAHSERIVEASGAAMSSLLRVLPALDDVPVAAPPRRLARQFDAWGRRSAIGVDPALALRAVTIWSRLHGLVGLEIGGNFASMGLDAGQLFEAELSLLVA